MKRFTFINRKGGVGKTTLTIGCTLALHALGKPTRIEDCDPQQTALRWWSQCVQEPVSGTPPVLFVDTPPDYDHPAWLRACHLSDLNIVVSSPSPADLWTTKDTIQKIRSLSDKPIHLAFNQVEKGTHLSAGIRECAEKLRVPCLQSVVHRRQAYQHSVIQGWKILPAECKLELQSLVMEILTLAV